MRKWHSKNRILGKLFSEISYLGKWTFGGKKLGKLISGNWYVGKSKLEGEKIQKNRFPGNRRSNERQWCAVNGSE